MPALSNFLRDELHRRDWAIEDFARRAHISTSLGYQIIRDGKDNVRKETLDGIANAFNMTAAQLLTVAEVNAGDPIEAAILARMHEMREAVRGTPREFWGTIIKTTFDRAIGGARDMAQLLTERPSQPGTVSNSGDTTLRKPIRPTNAGKSSDDEELAKSKHIGGVHRLPALVGL